MMAVQAERRNRVTGESRLHNASTATLAFQLDDAFYSL